MSRFVALLLAGCGFTLAATAAEPDVATEPATETGTGPATEAPVA